MFSLFRLEAWKINGIHSTWKIDWRESLDFSKMRANTQCQKKYFNTASFSNYISQRPCWGKYYVIPYSLTRPSPNVKAIILRKPGVQSIPSMFRRSVPDICYLYILSCALGAVDDFSIYYFAHTCSHLLRRMSSL